ncbi:jg6419 [Pararge aegeria aegeria]|uniref:Jg6419 protein n=1 Tax=Pararge aegeria aegeria TaxID=348720 RepID=A0A8S4S9Z0_9NEOP|nr:jg6419 [Pararge aegeria aegeria]
MSAVRRRATPLAQGYTHCFPNEFNRRFRTSEEAARTAGAASAPATLAQLRTTSAAASRPRPQQTPQKE